jgi:hypothetical protein
MDAFNTEKRMIPSAKAGAAAVGLLLVGVAGLGCAAAVQFYQDSSGGYFLHSYLVNFCFFTSLSLGALLFVTLQHIARAGWSVTVRRVAELLADNLAVMFPLLAPLAITVLAGNGALYPWAAPESTAADHVLHQKQAYLNPAFFVARGVGYFVVWCLMARYFLRLSVRQDRTGDPALTLSMERLSPPALILLVVTLTLASCDWLMSLWPHWWSTIFGVYFLAGAAVGAMALLILLVVLLERAGLLAGEVTIEHYHDLGKLLLASVAFWGYIAFSQYLLIWYANIPEETAWYHPRHGGPWAWVSLGLLVGHLVLPLFALLSRWPKRNRLSLAFWAVWLLVMHWIDIYWLVMLAYDPEQPRFGLGDVCCLGGMGAVYMAGLLWRCRNRSLVPLQDPRRVEALAFHNE